MAKTTPGLRQALKVVKQLGKQMNAESMADYNIAMSASAAGTRNLSRQTRALTRDLVLGQRFNQAAVAGYADRARASQRKVAGRLEGTVNRYGEAIGASAAQSYAKATATGVSGTQMARGAVKGSNQAAAAARTVAGIAAAGVAANKQAAGYAMAQALQQRNIVSAETIAGLTGQLYQTAMEYNMQWDMWKRQQDYLAKQKEDEMGVGGKSDALRLVNEGGEIGGDAANTYRDLKMAAGEDFDPASIDVTKEATTWAQANGYDPGGAEATLYAGILRNMKRGDNVDDAMEDAYTTLFGNFTGFDKWGNKIINGATAKASIEVARRELADWQEANPDAWWLEAQDEQAWADRAAAYVPMTEREFLQSNPGKTHDDYLAYVTSVQAAAAAAAGRGTSGTYSFGSGSGAGAPRFGTVPSSGHSGTTIYG